MPAPVALAPTSAPAATFHPASAPTHAVLQALPAKIITLLLRLLTRLGHLLEEEGELVLAGSVTDPDDVMTPLRTADAHSRIAQGTRAGQQVLSLQLAPRRPGRSGESSPLCANAHGVTACIQGCASPSGNAEGRMRWAQLSKHVFDINIERCPQCRAQMKLIAVIEEPLPSSASPPISGWLRSRYRVLRPCGRIFFMRLEAANPDWNLTGQE